MKRLLQILLTSLCFFQWTTAAQLYEGFHVEAGADDGRLGFMTSWHRLSGEIGIAGDSLPLPGFQQTKGALTLSKKGEAIAQIEADFSDTYYGSFRVRSARLNKDSLIGLLFARPDLDELTPKTANLSILVKAWRNEHGAILSGGKLFKTTEGVPIEEKKTYLVVFKVQDGSAGQRLVESWVLNGDQAQHFANTSFTESELNSASLGGEAGAVMQRARLNPKPSTNLSLRRGDVIACVAKFNPNTAFDEIRISAISLREAAGAL